MLIYRIEDQLDQAKRLINGTLRHPEILDKLEDYRYSKEEVFKAKILLEKVLSYQKKKEEEFGFKSTLGFKEDMKEAHRIYLKHLNIAKEAFPNRIKAENSSEDQESSQYVWLNQAFIFYENIMYSASELMDFGIEKSELEQAKAMILAAKASSERQKKSQHELQVLTEKRDQAYNSLLKWMFKYKAITQLVFEDDPEKMRYLGFSLES
jgi:hypothetical protein